MNNKFKDLSGKRFGMLTVLEEHESRRMKNNDTYVYWHCICDCGKDVWVRGVNLSYGTTKGCNSHRLGNVTHGLTNTRAYRIYYDMLQRCNNKNNTAYKYYGGRGIKVCEEWLGENGVVNFYNWSMENGYSDELTIDRIDVNDDYRPENCRWVIMLQQARNKRNTIWKMYNGEKYAFTELVEMGVEDPGFVDRKTSWKPEHWDDPYRSPRIVEYEGNKYTLKELSEIVGISYNTLNTRYSKGFSDEDIVKPSEELHKFRPVLQMDDDGNVINHFDSIKEASEKTGIRRNGINMCCSGQRKHCGGYVWKYDGEYEKPIKRMRMLQKHKEGGWIDNRGKLIEEIETDALKGV